MCMLSLFGSENWILSDSHLGMHGSLQRGLESYPNFTPPTIATRVDLKWSSVAVRILTKNYVYSKVSSEGESIGCHMCTTLQTSLPETYARMFIDGNCHGVSELVLGVTNKSLRLTGMVISSQASPHQSTSLAVKIATYTTWPKL